MNHMFSSSYSKRAESRSVAWKASCLFLALLVTFGLVPHGIAGYQAFGDSEGETGSFEVSDRMMRGSEQLVVVYEDEAPGLEDALSSDSETTLEDFGVAEQTELAPAEGGMGAIAVVKLEDGTGAEDVMENIEATDAVAYVQPDYSYELMEVDDPFASDSGDGANWQYYLEATGATAAWGLSKTEDSVMVAVLDTGIEMGHPDLAERIDAVHAFDVTTGLPLSGNSDDLDHGTLVAGVLAAQANNAQGIAGASYNASILPVKVFDDAGKCSTSSLIAAYAYLDDLMNRGELPYLKIINLSLGYYASDNSESDRALEEAISSMRERHDVLTVCAGGNGDAGSAGRCYPADFSDSIAVTGLMRDGSEAQWSAANDEKDISAPADGILSTSADGGYRSAMGTSMAAPQVSAAAALLWAADDSLTADEVENILKQSAASVPDMREFNGSAGALDMRGALEMALGVDSAEVGDEGSEGSGQEPLPDTESNEVASEDSGDSANASAEESAIAESGVEESASAADEAEEASGQGGQVVLDDPASSWRYRDGEKIQVSPEATTEDVSESEIRPLAAAEGVASYATWVKSNGATSYTWKAKPTDAGTRIAIPGAKRVGIDVSAWQGAVDWKKVKASGISFAIIRCGTYSKALKAHTIDPQFIANVKGARANGIDVGVYIYSYATSVTGKQSAESEAKNVLSFLKQAGLTSSNMALPVYYDLEDNSQIGFGSAKLGQMAKKFCDTVAAQGYSVGIYANQNWWRNYLTDPVFKSANWSRWAARYPGGNKANDSGVDRTDIWQFSDCGSVDGVKGYVDMNIDYGGAASYRKKTVANGEYMITSALDKKMMVDVPASSTADNQQLDLLRGNGQLNQRFTLSYDTKTGYYSVINVYSGKALAVSGATAKAGQPIVQATAKNTLAQRWMIRQVKSGVYTLHSALDPDFVLDVANGTAKDGAKLQLYPSNGTAAQQFRFSRTMPAGAICSKVIAPGLYTISTSMKSKMVLDVSTASSNNGANIQLYTANKTAAQRFRLAYDSKTGYYTIVNDNSGKVLDVKSASAKNGTNVHQYSSNGTLAQKWIISKEPDGTYRLSSALNTSFVLDVSSGKAANGANIQIYTTNKSAAQKFKFNKAATYAKTVESGTYLIGTTLTSSKVLDISGASKKNGGNVQLYTPNGTKAQRFKVTYEPSSGYYIIQNVNSSKVLDVSCARAANGTNVQQYASNASLAQRWVITKQGSSYKIASALNTNYVLDISGARKSNGANIQIYKSNGTKAQRFTFKKL